MDRADLPPLSIHTGGISVRTPALHGRPHRVGARPGIVHLMVWMAGCASYLAAMRMLAEGPISVRGSLYLVAHCLGQGAAMGATGWYVVSRLRGRQRALEPGEWLMVAVAARLLAQVAFYRGHAAGPELVLCWVYLLPLFSRHIALAWQVVFGLLLLARAVPLTLAVLGTWFGAAPFTWSDTLAQSPFPWSAAVVLAVPVVGIDVLRGRRYGWQHTVGLGVVLWDLLVNVMFAYWI